MMLGFKRLLRSGRLVPGPKHVVYSENDKLVRGDFTRKFFEQSGRHTHLIPLAALGVDGWAGEKNHDPLPFWQIIRQNVDARNQ